MFEKFVYNRFFDKWLVPINSKKDFKVFYDWCVSVKSSDFWYCDDDFNCYVDCYNCIFKFLKNKWYCGSSPIHWILNKTCYIINSYSTITFEENDEINKLSKE